MKRNDWKACELPNYAKECEMSLTIDTPFNALRLIDDSSCKELEGCDLENADVPFKAGMEVLKIMHPDKNQTVNGIPVVQFSHGTGHDSYCVKRSIFETCIKTARSEEKK
jgi:hypothetical protein